MTDTNAINKNDTVNPETAVISTAPATGPVASDQPVSEAQYKQALKRLARLEKVKQINSIPFLSFFVAKCLFN